MKKMKGITNDLLSNSFDKWSKETISYLKEISKEQEKEDRKSRKIWEREKNQKNTADEEEKETPEEVFKRYLKDLNLNVKSLKKKRILDLGCGKEADFVKVLEKRQDVNSKNLTGIDTEVNCDLKANILKDDFIKNFPKNSFDLIIAFGSISPLNKEMEDIKKLIIKALNNLNRNGKIKIFPIHRSIRNGLDDFKETKDILNEIENINVKTESKKIIVKGLNKDGSGKPLKEKQIWIETLITITKD